MLIVVSGQLTAFLRHRWGLNKRRDDGDLHHAMEAAVVAACSRSMIKTLSDYSRKRELHNVRDGYIDYQTGEVINLEKLERIEKQFPVPWPHFVDELIARLSKSPKETLLKIKGFPRSIAEGIKPIHVSRAVNRRIIGAFHKDTVKSARRFDEGLVIKRIELKNLSKESDIKKMVGYEDPRNQALIEAIKKRFAEYKLAHPLEKFKAEKVFKEPLFKPSKPGKTPPLSF